ncbi:MAG: penicillin-binding protein 1C [Alphaproteobacteria bacterium]|nr:penicillin-binding protein 1C [Alphaproteobacteria bacterium]
MLLGALALALGLLAGLDRLFPPSLARYEARSTLVLDREGGILRAFLTEDGKWRLHADPEGVDAGYLALLKAYEDRRFDLHGGIDPFALARAAAQWAVNGRIVSGASTLTMQAARLLDGGGHGPLAKLRQMARAVQLELRYPKDEILAIYLTLAPFGGNIEGARAASLAYFGKEPRELSLGQAALLVALPQSPEQRRPDRNLEAAREARDHVLATLLARGVLDARAVAEAREEAVPGLRRDLPFEAPRLAQALAARAAPGAEIRTAIDRGIESRLVELAAAEAPFLEREASLAIVVVENETKAVRGYLGGLAFDRPGGQLDGGLAVRSPGSTLKPFIYGLAFDTLGVHPETLIDDRPMLFGGYGPRNFDRDYQGTVRLADALRFSLNVPAVALLDGLGPARFAGALRQVGVSLVLPPSAEGPSLPIALGGVGISLRDLVTLYAGLGDGGSVGPLRFLEDEARNGRNGRRLMSPVAAYYVREALKESPAPNGFAAAALRARDVAFKTGTSYGFRDAWSIGVSPTYTVGVWVGRPDGSPRTDSTGRVSAAPLLLKVFDALPGETRKADAPPRELLAARSWRDLPRAMQRFEPQARVAGQRPGAAPPKIAFPPDGAVLSVADAGAPIALRVVGGVRPFRWLVNGELLPVQDYFASQSFVPDGPGFVELAVVDRDGRAAHVRVRLIEEAR